MRGEDTAKAADPCPDAETISAFFDGELPKGSPEAHHIVDCPQCAKVIASYAFMARALKKHVEAAVPEDINKKIMSAVRSRAMAPAPAPFPVLALRVAAGLVAAAAAIVVVVSAWNKGLIGPAKTSKVKGAETIAAESPFRETPSLSPKEPGPTAPSPEFSARPAQREAPGATSLPNLKPASFGAQATQEGAAAAGKVKSIARIGDSVRHVWVVGDLERQAAEFQRFVSAVGGVCGQPELQRGHAELRAAMTKAQLADLVRRCAMAGFKLTSPSQPQPEQERFADGADEPVAYSVDLVAE